MGRPYLTAVLQTSKYGCTKLLYNINTCIVSIVHKIMFNHTKQPICNIIYSATLIFTFQTFTDPTDYRHSPQVADTTTVRPLLRKWYGWLLYCENLGSITVRALDSTVQWTLCAL